MWGVIILQRNVDANSKIIVWIDLSKSANIQWTVFDIMGVVSSVCETFGCHNNVST
jgi:hypothetical protein